MISVNSTSPQTQAVASHFIASAKFGLVGATTAAILFLVMWFANSVLRLTYIGTISLAYFASTVFHFLANRHFTFAAAHGRPRSQIVRYLLVCFVNYLITIIVVGLCVESFHFPPYIGVCISVLFTASVGYMLGRYWVFEVPKKAL